MENIQEQEVLIARNNETGQVGAVVGQNPDGTPQMTDAKTAKLSDLVKFNKGQNPLEAFISNFIRQAQNPSLFGFFKLPADHYDAIAPAMVDLLQDPVANGEMLKPYEVDMTAMSNTQAQESETHAQAESTETQVGPMETEQTQEAQTEAQSTGIRKAPVDVNMIDWAAIEKQWGISRENLEQSGALQPMLYNHKSPQLLIVTPQFGDEKFCIAARLSFSQNPDGTFGLVPHFIKNEPKLNEAFRGYEFTKEDKEQLLKTGNLGKVVELADPKTGEMQKCLVSIDRLTNDIETMPVDKIFIKNRIGKTELSMKEIGILKDGGVVKGKEIELNNGRKFTSDLQYNADNKKVVGVAEESRTQYAVNNQGKTNEATKNITDPLQKGQTAPKNEQQQTQQQPKGPKI